MKCIALCQNRHITPAEDKAVFPYDFAFFDCNKNFNEKRCISQIKKNVGKTKHLKLIVTGFSPALICVIKYCLANDVSLELLNFNSDKNEYFNINLQDLKGYIL